MSWSCFCPQISFSISITVKGLFENCCGFFCASTHVRLHFDGRMHGFGSRVQVMFLCVCLRLSSGLFSSCFDEPYGSANLFWNSREVGLLLLFLSGIVLALLGEILNKGFIDCFFFLLSRLFWCVSTVLL